LDVLPINISQRIPVVKHHVIYFDKFVQTSYDWTMEFVQRTPLYLQVSKQIIDRIKQGAYENNILPSEEQLSKTLRISRNTLREALAELTNMGIVTKRQGIGNVIMPSALDTRFRIDLKIDFTLMLSDLGFKVAYEQSYSRFEAVSNKEFSEESLVYDELLLADERVAAILQMAIPARILTEEVPHELPKKSFFDFIYTYTQETIAHSVVHFEATAISASMARHFGIDRGTPVLSWTEVFRNLKDKCISFNRIYFNPEVFQPTILRNGFYQEDLNFEVPCMTKPSLNLS